MKQKPMEQIKLNNNYASINNKLFISNHNKYKYGFKLLDVFSEYNNTISTIYKSNISLFSKLPPRNTNPGWIVINK